MKIKEYLKSKNPYLLASAAIVIVSVGIIIALLQEKPAEESDSDVTSVAQENVSESQESGQQDTEASEESWGIDDVETESKEKEETENVTVETAERGAETASESSRELQQAPAAEESCEPVKEPDGEAKTGEELETTPEITPEKRPEEESQEIPETDTGEVVVPEPEETPKPSEVPGPLEIPEPEEHQHSWIFESYYQEPTCSNGGLVTQICAHCGETQITGGIPTGEHAYEVETKGDCCSAEVVVCTECNYREVREKDPAKHIDVEAGFCYGCGHKTE